MAEAGTTYLLNKLDILITVIQKEAGLLGGVEEEIEHLMGELSWMRKYLHEADARHTIDDDPEIQQIIDLTYKAEDVIDDFVFQVQRHRRRQKELSSVPFLKMRFLKRFMLRIRGLPGLHEFKRQIIAINKKSDRISTNRTKYPTGREHASASFPLDEDDDQYSYPQQRIKRRPIVEELNVVGMADSIKQLTSLLMPTKVSSSSEGHNKQQLMVVSIVGMGGLGKTTVATNIYKTTDTDRYFNVTAWVYVSQESRVVDLLRSIIRQVTNDNYYCENRGKDEAELRMMLYNYLLERRHKRYLIVLDDVWHTYTWKHLQSAFPETNNGCKILLTTRNLKVARLADPSHDNIHVLRLLDNEESWELFQKKTFPLGGGCPPEFVDLGKKMVDKCCGLPLGVVVLGGILMIKDKTLAAWSKVHDSVNWELTHGENSNLCSGILAFSYYDMPYYLKPCFMDIGLFPEDREIRASKLFNLWIAEGYVRREGDKTLEDTAEDYLEELIHRSLIKIGRWRYDGRVKTCRIHDLLRDLANSKSQKLRFLQVNQRDFRISTATNTRRLSIHGDPVNYTDEGTDFEYVRRFRSTRTVMFHKVQELGAKSSSFFTALCRDSRLLTVLDIESSMHGKSIPAEIRYLQHLRYFSCNATSNLKILEYVGEFVNLQTLIIKGKCIYMPDIWSLHQLRHLDVDLTFSEGYSVLSNRNLVIDNLTNLQTLSISYGFWMNDVRWDRLKMLKKFSITTFGQLRFKKEFIDSIAKLTSLRSLKLMFGKEIQIATQFAQNTNLTKLYLRGPLPEFLFPPNLVKLVLSSSNRSDTDLMVVLGNLTRLKFLEFRPLSYTASTMTFPTGLFVRLQSLEIAGFPDLCELIMEEGALISLTHLVIRSCELLMNLPERIGHLQLQVLQLYNMHPRLTDRLKENVGENWDQIKHIPSVVITQ
ncbi:hypothetical protein MKW94_000845 [Papaver nudicaule]|uniref:Uncharacterized protein n=1 Tax=Papaver nudicaule TaxID=74823 RepID=A0AA41VGE7_PAPNU|nr:hypothetical protein [Papaver nudicaule]